MVAVVLTLSLDPRSPRVTRDLSILAAMVTDEAQTARLDATTYLRNTQAPVHGQQLGMQSCFVSVAAIFSLNASVFYTDTNLTPQTFIPLTRFANSLMLRTLLLWTKTQEVAHTITRDK